MEWTKEEEAILRANYPVIGVAVIQLLPGRTWKSCAAKAKAMGLRVAHPRAGNVGQSKAPWSAAELNILVKKYRTMGSSVAKLLTGRTELACSQQAIRMGLTGDAPLPWTEEEVQILVDSAGKLTHEEIARKLGKSVSAVRGKARTLDLESQVNTWTEEELVILKQYYPIEGPACVARLPRHTSNAIRHKANDMGLRVTATDLRYLDGEGKCFEVEINNTVCRSRVEVATNLGISRQALDSYLRYNECSMNSAVEYYLSHGWLYGGRRYLRASALCKQLGCSEAEFESAIQKYGWPAAASYLSGISNKGGITMKIEPSREKFFDGLASIAGQFKGILGSEVMVEVTEVEDGLDSVIYYTESGDVRELYVHYDTNNSVSCQWDDMASFAKAQGVGCELIEVLIVELTSFCSNNGVSKLGLSTRGMFASNKKVLTDNSFEPGDNGCWWREFSADAQQSALGDGPKPAHGGLHKLDFGTTKPKKS